MSQLLDKPSAPSAGLFASSRPQTVRRVALIGNPNTGKTTLFNALTGHRARVGNYAGVTVERREGTLRNCFHDVTMVDLPGTYSLSAHSPDEMVAVNLLLGLMPGEVRPDIAVVVVDASNLDRNLFLVTQVMELGVPVVVALNMMDQAEGEGLRIDVARLESGLGVPVIPMVARSRRGIERLVEAIAGDVECAPARPLDIFPPAFHEIADELKSALSDAGVSDRLLEPFLVTRPLLESEGLMERLYIEADGKQARHAIDTARARMAELGMRPRSLEATSRYKAIRALTEKCVTSPEGRQGRSLTDRVDALLTHRVYGFIVFLAMMALVFQAIYTWSAPLMEAIETTFAALGGTVGGFLPEGPLQSLIVNGVIAGVGSVVVFLPQICILFLFIALLEDVGYMARAAFLMDRVLAKAGLSGRSFIPMLGSFACAVPGIMAARSIENRRDRIATILAAPLMSCSARLPVYTILIAAFVPAARVGGVLSLQGLVLLAMYLLGIVVAVPFLWLLKRTFLRGRTPPFVIELPPYRAPMMLTVLHRVVERAREFLVRAGTVILAASIVIWALSYYPRSSSVETAYQERVSEIEFVYTDGEELEAALMEAENWRDGEFLRASYLGRAGQWIEPAVRPLGWDWRIGMATLASFPAREVVIATLGVIFDLGEVEDEDAGLISRMREATWPDGRPLFTLPVALSLMVFFALCLQCAATLATMRQETNSWRWPVFAFFFMTAVAYAGAFLVYHIAAFFL